MVKKQEPTELEMQGQSKKDNLNEIIDVFENTELSVERYLNHLTKALTNYIANLSDNQKAALAHALPLESSKRNDITHITQALVNCIQTTNFATVGMDITSHGRTQTEDTSFDSDIDTQLNDEEEFLSTPDNNQPTWDKPGLAIIGEDPPHYDIVTKKKFSASLNALIPPGEISDSLLLLVNKIKIASDLHSILNSGEISAKAQGTRPREVDKRLGVDVRLKKFETHLASTKDILLQRRDNGLIEFLRDIGLKKVADKVSNITNSNFFKKVGEVKGKGFVQEAVKEMNKMKK